MPKKKLITKEEWAFFFNRLFLQTGRSGQDLAQGEYFRRHWGRELVQ